MAAEPHEICCRIAEVRNKLTGPRGRAAFAQRIGVPPSTYQNYESVRVPPADVLVRIADEADVSLRWLLTGEDAGEAAVPADHPVLVRAARLLSERPGSGEPLAAFLDILEAAAEFPEKPGAAGAAPPAPLSVAAAGDSPSTAARPSEAWIPLLGRSAAGVPHFWGKDDDPAGETALANLVARHADRPATRRRVVHAVAGDRAEGSAVALVVLPAPEQGEVAEFVVAPEIKRRHADAFALRVDGDSMSPEIRHGDVVILSPSEPAAPGRAAVVQLDRQIGVTCKLYRREGERVHLIPLNETFPPQTFSAGQVVWALRVLARIRPS